MQRCICQFFMPAVGGKKKSGGYVHEKSSGNDAVSGSGARPDGRLRPEGRRKSQRWHQDDREFEDRVLPVCGRRSDHDGDRTARGAAQGEAAGKGL